MECRATRSVPIYLPEQHRQERALLTVVLSEDGVFRELKVFSTIPDALAFARQRAQAGDDAKVYDVPAATAPAAKAAIEMGEGRLIAAPSRQPTEAELAARRKRQARRDLLDLL